MNRKKLDQAVDKARRVINPQRFSNPRELASGVDKGLDKKQWVLWSKIKARFNDEEFTHSLLDRLITTFILNCCVAAVWLMFGYIAWKLFTRG